MKQTNLIIIAAVLIFLYGCFLPVLRRAMPEGGVKIPVIFTGQKDDSLCGEACAEMIVNFYGKKIGKRGQDIMETEAKKSGGIKAGTIKNILDNCGLKTAVFPGSPDEQETGIFRHLKSGRPLIALISPAPEMAGHYIVLSGYEPDTEKLIVQDPENGTAQMDYERFLKLWENSKFLTVLAIP